MGWEYNGAVWEGSLHGIGSNGSFWSSTLISSDYAYLLGYASDGWLNPSGNGYLHRYGFPIRCGGWGDPSYEAHCRTPL